MRLFLPIAGLFIVVVAIMAAFLWLDRDPKNDATQDQKSISYRYSNEIPDEYIITKLPKLPDLSPYTAKAVGDKKKPIKAGYTLVQKFQDGYRRMRLNIDFFAKLQERREPLIITIADGVYDLETLTNEINNEKLIEKKNGVFYLYVPLTIRGTGMLVVEDDTLRLSADKGVLINNFGHLLTLNATLEGWNTQIQKPAWYEKSSTFRPHIINWCGSRMDMAGSTISHLGYQESKSYGITYTSCVDTFYRRDYGHLPGGTGWLIDNKFNDIYFGFYSYEADDVVILGNEYKDSIIYGIDPHDRSHNLIIAHNKVSGTKKKHGIIGSRGVSHSYIIYNHTENNNGSGIMLDRGTNHNVVAHNLSQNNGSDGITFYESAHNISFNNSFINNGKSGMRLRNSWDTTSYQDVMNANKSAAVELYTQYLKIEEARDLMLDPYEQKAGVIMIEPEIIGNKTANFKVKNIDQFILYHPRFFNVPNKQFSSEDNALSSTLESMLSNNDTKIFVEQKK